MDLTDRGIERLIAKGAVGDHRDGDALFVRIGAKRVGAWFLGYRLDGKQRTLKLGVFPELGCHTARDRAEDIRKAVALGVDPRETFDFSSEANSDGELGPESPFGDVVRAYHETIKGTFKSDKYRSTWISQLKPFTDPAGLGGKPIGYVSSNDVRKVLSPIWESKHVTGKKLYQRLDAVFVWAAEGGIVDQSAITLMKMVRSRLQKIKYKGEHHKSLIYAELPDFVQRLRDGEVMSGLCLQWIILTYTRSIEARGMRWEEVDFDACTWTIPGERLKPTMMDEHVVYLCETQMAFLRRVLAMNIDDDLVFMTDRGKMLGVNAFRALFQRMSLVDAGGRVTLSAHGFRSTFRTFAERMTDFPTKMIEEMLGHTGNAVEEAYRRGARREHVMRELAQLYCDYALGDVTLEWLEAKLAA